jgi:hypothetical protein
MDSDPFIVSTKVNGIYFIKALIDSECLAYGTVSQRFTRKWRLKRIFITSRPLIKLISMITNTNSEVAYINIDFDNY